MTMMTKAGMGRLAYMTEPGKVEIREYPLPESLEPGAVLLKVLQTNICGSDVHIFCGHHPLLKKGGLGHEMVGEVVAIGAGRTTDSAGRSIAVGDRIVPVYTSICHACENCDRGVVNHCDHAFDLFGHNDQAPYFKGATFCTHYIIDPGQHFYRVPDGVPTTAAASANCALAQVLHGLDKAQVSLGQVVVIQGAGGLGLYSAAVAKKHGARVVVMDRVPSRLDMARDFGADLTLNVDEVPDLNDRVARIQAFAGAQGADVVVEVTGVPAVFAEGVHYLRPEGTYVVMGTISPGNMASFDPAQLVRRSARILGVNRYPPHYLKDALAFLDQCGEEFPFARMSDKTFPLDELQTAIDMSAARKVQRAAIIP